MANAMWSELIERKKSLEAVEIQTFPKAINKSVLKEFLKFRAKNKQNELVGRLDCETESQPEHSSLCAREVNRQIAIIAKIF